MASTFAKTHGGLNSNYQYPPWNEQQKLKGPPWKKEIPIIKNLPFLSSSY